jgi:hypothetical protein
MAKKGQSGGKMAPNGRKMPEKWPEMTKNVPKWPKKD